MQRLIVVAFLIIALTLGLSAAPAQVPVGKDAAALEETQDVVLLTDPSPLLVRFHIRIEGMPFRAAWAKSMQRIFNALDRDRNGILTHEEIERLPPAQLLFSSGSTQHAAQMLLKVLTDDRGVQSTPPLSPDELTRFLRTQGGRPFHVYSTGRAQTSGIWSINSGDVLYISDGRNRGGDVNDVVFGLVDPNSDGRLSGAELEAAIKKLAKYDKDEDEMIAQDELMPPRNTGAYLLYDVSGRAYVAESQSVLFALEGNGQVAAQLLKRYGPKENPQQKLSREQIGLSAEDFARLDANRDGTLDALELARFGQRPPDLEFRVRLGRGAAPILEPIRNDGAIELSREQGVLSAQRGPTRLIFGLESDKYRPSGLLASYKNMFKGFDQDMNGYLDKKEAGQHPIFTQLFKQMDKDGDGQLFEKEMIEYLSPWADLHDGAEASCASLAVSEEGRGLFDLLDANRDGRLSVREIRQLPKLLERFDFNKDGHLQKEEFPRTFRLHVRQGSQAVAHTGVVYALAFGDGLIPATPLPELKDGPLWFRKMDRNRDGDVSRAEFLGTDEEFARIDTDGDGLIGLQEAERFDAQMRQRK